MIIHSTTPATIYATRMQDEFVHEEALESEESARTELEGVAERVQVSGSDSVSWRLIGFGKGGDCRRLPADMRPVDRHRALLGPALAERIPLGSTARKSGPLALEKPLEAIAAGGPPSARKALQ